MPKMPRPLARNSQLSAVMERREELLARIASQRQHVVELGAQFDSPLAMGDRVAAVARFVRSHPILVGAVVAALVMRRRGMAGAIGVGWRLWNRYRYFSAAGGKLASLINGK